MPNLYNIREVESWSPALYPRPLASMAGAGLARARGQPGHQGQPPLAAGPALATKARTSARSKRSTCSTRAGTPPPPPLPTLGVPHSGLDRNGGTLNSLSYNIGLRILVCLHTSFFHLNLPHAPKAGGLLLDYDLGHLVGAILQVVTPPPAASSGHFGLLLLLLHPVAYLGVSGIESSRQRPPSSQGSALAAAAIAAARVATSRFGTFTRESVSRVTRSCEKRTDADALTGLPSCSARLRRSACTFSGTSSSAPSPVSADTPSHVGVTSQIAHLPLFRGGHRGVPARDHGFAGLHQVGTKLPCIRVVGVLRL